MKKEQRLRYEMFVRVRDFGAANAELFPESSAGGELFGQLKAMVDTFEEQLKNRDLARAEAQRVKATTRAAVVKRMQTIAAAARRVSVVEPGANTFRMPSRKSAAVVLAKARLFLDEVAKRRGQFDRVGLAPVFISEFETLVNQLEQAVTVRLNSKTRRGNAQTGIEDALKRGFGLIRDLEVAVLVTLRNQPVLMGGWRAARRLEGLPHHSTAGEHSPVEGVTLGAEPVVTPAVPTTAPAVVTPAVEKAS